MKTGTVIDLFPGGLSGFILAIGCALCVAGVGVQQYRVVKRDATIATLRGAAAQYADAQTTNLATIKRLRDAHTALVEARRLEASANVAAVARADNTIAQVNARNAQLRGELANVYRNNPQARAWGAVGVDPAVAARLPAGRPH